MSTATPPGEPTASSRESSSDIALDAIALAERLLRDSQEAETDKERKQRERLSGLIAHSDAKNLSFLMTDRLGRSKDAARTSLCWRRILNRIGISEGFSSFDRFLMKLGAFGSRFLPGVVMEAIRRRMRQESSEVILPADEAGLAKYLATQRTAGNRVNLNQLGEAILGEEEAARRLANTLRLVEDPNVRYASVKLSAIFSQINLVAWDETLEHVKDRLRTLYRAALKHQKFVNLDMEEYRDLALTVTAFREVLDEPEFSSLTAGVALQAYLPDSIAVQQELTTWAQERCANGGAPMRIRLVKGANLAMESVEADLHGWNPAPHRCKHDSDACFKQMLEFACQPENAAVVRVGVGSHNLFDLALALTLRKHHGIEEFIEIEMLEGMSPPQSRAVREVSESILFYAPIVRDEDYGSALAYLIRRLDENTAAGNFLADLFSLTPGSDTWYKQRDAFLAAWTDRHRVDAESRRGSLPERPENRFSSEPDTDWTQPCQRARLVPCPQVVLPTFSDAEAIDAALTRANEAQPNWEARSEEERADLLRRCAAQLRKTRFDSIALLNEEGKKAIAEADTEVSESIDFANYYADSGRSDPSLKSSARGTVVITPPWNFPFAIPCGGVLAALMAGNTVILKPAPETPRLGWWLAEQLWEAGVPRDVLQCLLCNDGKVSSQLITDSRVNAIILTGAYETAQLFHDWRPSLPLFAETSGKNSLVVSALADRELAARDLVRSAFGHSGQKCSAASLGILEAEVYDDPNFRRQLRDAAASLPVGSASRKDSIVTPLVQEPGENLRRALTTLEESEEWLLEPRADPDDPCLWSPGIKLGVRKGSWFHQTECFGPVLGLIRAENLDEAVSIQNSVSFGLTAGLHSLDEDEIAAWKAQVEAGNLYINRSITGAIVERQPFGGWKRSSIGPGSKAGGPNYVNLFRQSIDLKSKDPAAAERDFQDTWENHFQHEHDPAGLTCETNTFRYRPASGILLRLPTADPRIEKLATIASRVSGVPLVISRADEEDPDTLIARLPELAERCEFLRTLGSSPEEDLLRAAHCLDLNWIDAPLVTNARLELTRWTREQSVSETRHRYGNVLR